MMFAGLFIGLNVAVLALYVFVNPSITTRSRSCRGWWPPRVPQTLPRAGGNPGPAAEATRRGPNAADLGRGLADPLRGPVRNAGRLVPSEVAPAYTLAPGVLLLMPLARLSAMPLALDWNRHR